MNNKYEALFIVRPDLSEDDKNALFNQVKETVSKFNGNILSANIWSERKKLCFPIKKYEEGTYYLMNFNINSLSIKDLRNIYKLNENILRFLITRLG